MRGSAAVVRHPLSNARHTRERRLDVPGSRALAGMSETAPQDCAASQEVAGLGKDTFLGSGHSTASRLSQANGARIGEALGYFTHMPWGTDGPISSKAWRSPNHLTRFRGGAIVRAVLSRRLSVNGPFVQRLALLGFISVPIVHRRDPG